MSSCYLYLAVLNDSDRFKVGIASDVTRRWMSLGINGELSEEQSLTISGLKADITHAERALLFLLNPWHAPHPSGRDGHTEWFSTEGLDVARKHFLALAEHDQRFTLEKIENLMTKPKPSASQSQSGISPRRQREVKLAQEVNETCRTVEEYVPQVMENVKTLSHQACGMLIQDGGKSITLCFEGLSSEQCKALSILSQSGMGVNFPLAISQLFGCNFITGSSWQFDPGDLSAGWGTVSIYTEALRVFVDTIRRLTHIKDIDWEAVASCETSLAALMRECESLRLNLPSLEGIWPESEAREAR